MQIKIIAKINEIDNKQETINIDFIQKKNCIEKNGVVFEKEIMGLAIVIHIEKTYFTELVGRGFM